MTSAYSPSNRPDTRPITISNASPTNGTARRLIAR
jgi:hypothetical protein